MTCLRLVKTCNSCSEEKSLEEFQVRSSAKDGRTSMCKVCKRAYDNNHYKSNPKRKDYIRKNSKTRIESIRAWVIAYMQGNPCVDCGESDIVVLEFDHRSDKEFTIGKMIHNYSLERIVGEVEKCDVRCCNCHRRKTARDFGWYRYLI